MSNAIEGVSLPASVVGMARSILEGITTAHDMECARYRHSEFVGMLITLECLQRVNRTGLQRLAHHAQQLVSARWQALESKAGPARGRAVSL